MRLNAVSGQLTPDLVGARAALVAAQARAAAADVGDAYDAEFDAALDAAADAAAAASAANVAGYFADTAEADAYDAEDDAYVAAAEDDADAFAVRDRARASRAAAMLARANAEAAQVEAAQAADAVDTQAAAEAAYHRRISGGIGARAAFRRVADARLRYERVLLHVRRPPPSAPRYARSSVARRGPTRQRTPRRARASAPLRAGPDDGPPPDPEPARSYPRERGERAQPWGCA